MNSAGGIAATGGATQPGSTGGNPGLGQGGNMATGGSILSSTGGAAPIGGANATGGTTPATGGTKATGGTTVTGGTAATGGTKATGGIAATGGTKSTGGAMSTGGTTNTGGTLATGGSKATGGVPATGGAATGGSKATGGTTATGGTKATGGTLATGGTKATGGTPSTTNSCATVGGGTCPSSLTCPNAGNGTITCGCYIVPGLGANKKAILDAGASQSAADQSYVQYLLASAMIETALSDTNYPLGDNKTGDSFNAGVAKQNLGMIKVCHPAIQTTAQATAMNSNRALDVQVYVECRKYYGSSWWAGHRNGSSGISNPNTPDIQNFKAGEDWTNQMIQSGNHQCDNVRFWVSLPAIIIL